MDAQDRKEYERFRRKMMARIDQEIAKEGIKYYSKEYREAMQIIQEMKGILH